MVKGVNAGKTESRNGFAEQKVSKYQKIANGSCLSGQRGKGSSHNKIKDKKSEKQIHFDGEGKTGTPPRRKDHNSHQNRKNQSGRGKKMEGKCVDY